MSKTSAIILSVIGGLFLLGIIAVGGFFYWVYQNSARQSAIRRINEFEEFGAKTDNQGCLEEALARYKRDRSFSDPLAPESFVTYCLKASRPSPGFCDGVPPDETSEGYNWDVKRCNDAGFNCYPELFHAVRKFCHNSAASPDN